MNPEFLFAPESLLLLIAIFIGALCLFSLINKNFTHGIYLWLLSIILFQYQDLGPLHSVSRDISIDRILFVMLIVVFILKSLSKKRSGLVSVFAPKGIAYSMLLLCLITAVSVAYTGSFLLKGELAIGHLFSFLMVPFCIFLITQNIYDSPGKIDSFFKFLVLLGLYLVYIAIAEHFNLDSLIFPRYILDSSIGIHAETGRARGPFCQSAINGLALGFSFFASFYFLLKDNINNNKRIWKIFSYILLFLAPFGIYFTYTRAAWVGIFLGFAAIILFCFKQRKKSIIVFFLIVSITIALVISVVVEHDALATKRALAKSSIYDRLNLYTSYLATFVHHPLFGVGFGNFQKYASDYFKDADGFSFSSTRLSELGIHDTFAGFLVEMGIVGALLILYIYIAILSKSIRLYKYLTKNKLSNDKNIIFIFWCFVIVYTFSANLSDMRYFTSINTIFLMFSGIICRLERDFCEKFSKERRLADKTTIK